MALHCAIHLAVRQCLVDVRRADRLEVPAAAQDTAAAPSAGGLHDALRVDLALSLLRSA